MSKLITKERFVDLDVPNLLVNVFGYDNIVTLKLHKKWCLEILEEKWNVEEWLHLELVLKNLKNPDFFELGKVRSADLDGIYTVLRKDFWKNYHDKLIH